MGRQTTSGEALLVLLATMLSQALRVSRPLPRLTVKRREIPRPAVREEPIHVHTHCGRGRTIRPRRIRQWIRAVRPTDALAARIARRVPAHP